MEPPQCPPPPSGPKRHSRYLAPGSQDQLRRRAWMAIKVRDTFLDGHAMYQLGCQGRPPPFLCSTMSRRLWLWPAAPRGTPYWTRRMGAFHPPIHQRAHELSSFPQGTCTSPLAGGRKKTLWHGWICGKKRLPDAGIWDPRTWRRARHWPGRSPHSDF